MQFLKEEFIVDTGLMKLIMEQEKRVIDDMPIVYIDIIATEIKSYIYDPEHKFNKISEFVISFVKLIERTDNTVTFKAGIKLLSKLLQNSINSFEDMKTLKESIKVIFKRDPQFKYIYNERILNEVREGIHKILVDDCIDLFFDDTILYDSTEFYPNGMPPVDPWNPDKQPKVIKKGDKYVCYTNDTSGKSFNI